jgi:hypothetical protein
MHSKSIALFWLLVAAAAQAQTGSLSGVVTGPSGTPVPNASISVKNVASGQSVSAQTASDGKYSVPNLAPGEYQVSVSVSGVGEKTSTITVAAGPSQALDLALTPPGAPSLGDLGFAPDALKGSAVDQARLDKRTRMLKTHQKLGLITTAPLIATLITSSGAGGRNSTSSARELHAILGGTTAALYFTTASFAIFAPKIPGTPTRGPIRVHKALAWVHGAGMILTPILGTLAYDQKNRGEKVHGIASAHGAVAAVTGAAYGAALLSVTIKF